jgi:RNA polymerase sigma-70 factor (ECF subfamily)
MTLADPHLDFIFNVAFRLSGNRYDAEDLSQETMTVAFDKFSQLKDHERVRYWLLAILRNLYLRSHEKQRPTLLDVPDEESYNSVFERMTAEGTPESEFFEIDSAREVQGVLNRLPEKYKTPLILFYTEEWSYREIADGLDLPMGTVMSRIARGRDLVKKELLQSRKTKGERKVIFTDFSRRGGGKS